MPRHLHIRTVLAGAVLAAALLSTACGGNRPVVTGPAEVLLHTTAGDIRLELDGRTPRHRDNFLELAREGFFDSLLFHRVIAGFMIQSGDPDSRRAPSGQPLGLADAGCELPAEIVYPALGHTRGALAAARTPDDVNPERKSSGSQFYIVWGKPMDDGELDRAQERVRAGTNRAGHDPRLAAGMLCDAGRYAPPRRPVYRFRTCDRGAGSRRCDPARRNRFARPSAGGCAYPACGSGTGTRGKKIRR